MTNYSSSPGSVEANLFVRRDEGFSGKWKYTVALDMTDFWDHMGPAEAVKAAWDAGKQDQVQQGATGFWLVVAHPYHRYSYPVMVAI